MLRRVLRLARMLCALMYHQNSDLENLLKSARKKSAPECPFECGGGVQLLFGQCPNRGDANFKGASLTGFDNYIITFGGHCKYCNYSYLIFVIFFTQAKILDRKFYTEERVNYGKRILRQNSVN